MTDTVDQFSDELKFAEALLAHVTAIRRHSSAQLRHCSPMRGHAEAIHSLVAAAQEKMSSFDLEVLERLIAEVNSLEDLPVLGLLKNTGW
ncbi:MULTISPECIES: hypothetical protein [unclassified Mesorhizobium]|uniref:hypothetical protein n=1 Tax=unclassified Mesorhizobium TaxID=325217 RepID=UPI001128FE5D|nr:MULTISPECIES: hypothetical protein [unclassified Mesorhizobium]TPK53807.1 hypothetical protein FJ550_09425 [Mesorhizobium sp. B2-5-2]TPL17184.1 hypothetical protein FJ946_28855 [Mesorhizobium sp. B2-4-7]TPL33405.1 hypothetical protein FJ961_28825 [Mesorhizobium sp. B2-4-5]TPM69155.1 hypothetical protein FJ968_28440 [Mesorhizobium sp. B2-1-6]TPN73640.1 hypothetical protein FJ985_25795 [Mesorhizobium sp. B1-1-2]